MSFRHPRLFILLAVIALLLAVLRTAGDAGFWRRYLPAVARGQALISAQAIVPRVPVAGSGGIAVPRAGAEAEGLAPEAIDAVLEQARSERARALIVHRHGHRIAEYFAGGVSADSESPGGDLAPLPLALAWGSLIESGDREAGAALASLSELFGPEASGNWRNPWSAAARRHFALRADTVPRAMQTPEPVPKLVSQRVWQRLGAADASMWGSHERSLRLTCCFVARIDDWMRVGDLLLQQGQYNGERIVTPEWIRELLVGDTGPTRRLYWLAEPSPLKGDEPPAARDALWADLGPDARLWLFPQRGLAVLHWAQPGSGRSQDTTLPNVVIRGIVDQNAVPATAAPIREMVPGH